MHDQVTETDLQAKRPLLPVHPPKKSDRIKISSKQAFYSTLKSRVEARLAKSERSDVLRHYVKASMILSVLVFCYLCIFLISNPWVQLVLCFFLGLTQAVAGFNVYHEAIHASFSKLRWVNRGLAFLSCSLIGAAHFPWRHKHNYLHHQFPNIQNQDDDLETRGWLRLSPSQKWRPLYKYQHLYAPFVYCFVTLEWFFIKDFKQYFGGQINEHQKMPKLKGVDQMEFWLAKLIYFNLYLLIPFNFLPTGHFLIGLFCLHFALGLSLSAIFQLAHVTEETSFPLPNQVNTIDMSWGELQLRTTINFAPKNYLVTWLAGGLNYQIEHHLFPQLPHTAYPLIAPIVEKTAEEFALPYKSVPSYLQALKMHFRTLKSLGLSKF